MRAPRLRPGHPGDLDALAGLWREQASFGARDALPARPTLERLLAGFDWVSRSRVHEGDAGLDGVVLVAVRSTADGLVARLESGARAPEVDAEMLRWGLEAARSAGAAVASVWRGRGHGRGLGELGFSHERPFWRMDRPNIESLPTAPLPPGYRVAGARDVDAEAFARAYNRAFAGHWRHTEKTADGWRRREAAVQVAAVDAAGEVAAVVAGGVDTFDDRRAQPVGVVEIVGTVPEHRRAGLARALTVLGLRRLRAAGAASASLYVDGRNAQRAFDLYRSLGFGIAFEFEVWEQPL